MGKLEKFFIGLQAAQNVVNGLDEAGIDVGRLVQISNAQGPAAKLIHGFIVAAGQQLNQTQASRGQRELVNLGFEIRSSPKARKALPPKSKQKKPSKSSG